MSPDTLSEPHDPADPARILAEPRPTGRILQSFCPVQDSVDWRLSRMFWETRGRDAFFGGDVPYVVTNDGHLAGNAVEVLLASLAAEDDGEDVILVEMGAGSGLFAKQFLDQLRNRCRETGRDIYDRTLYVVTDGAPAMVEGISESGVLADHAERVVPVTARLPGLPGALAEVLDRPPEGRVRGIFANYVLDSLPFTILARKGDALWELEMQTAVSANRDAGNYVDLSDDEIARRIEADEGLDDLVGLYPALVIDSRYEPIRRDTLPRAETIPEGGDETAAYLHSHGALDAIDEALSLLHPAGIMLVSDYGTATLPAARRMRGVPALRRLGGHRSEL